MRNNLYVVGVGIKFQSHLTTEAKSCIEQADKVLYLVNEPAIKEWIKITNPNSESLDHLYAFSDSRNENYERISDYICELLDKTKILCFVMYGHPTVLANPTMYAIKKAKARGHNVYVMPGISSEDCLYADLVIDPSSCGIQSFEATDLLLYGREIDTSCHLILFQAGMIGIKENYSNQNPKEGLTILTEHLLMKYSKEHKIILYEAAQYPSIDPQIKEILLAELPESKVTPLTTIYIPPNKTKHRNEIYVRRFNEMN